MNLASPRFALLLLLSAVVSTRALSLYSFYLYDDAFITFRIVENLVSGQGFVYQVGERVQGITTPLWGFVLAAPAALGISLEIASRGLAIGLDLITGYLLFRYLSRQGLLEAAIAVLFLFGMDLYLAKTAVGGMESSLFLLLTVGATLSALQGRFYLAAILAALSVFVRPEGLIFALCLLGYARVTLRDFRWPAVALGAALIVLGTCWQYSYYGSWIPQSVQGKIALPDSRMDLVKLVLFPLRDPLQFILTPLSLYFLPRAWRSSDFVKLFTVWAFTLLLVWFITGAHLWSWYVVPVWFWKVLVVGVGIGSLMSRQLLWNRRMDSPLLINRLSAALLLVTVAVWSTFTICYGPDRMEKNVYSKIRAWAHTQNFSGHERAYGMDFGAFGYYTGLKILDEPGLVWPEAIIRYGSRLDSILIHEQPEYAFVTANRDNIATMRSAHLQPMYTPLWRASMRGDTALAVPLTELATDWAPDFILYQRTYASH